ncbi:hypothetical protein [Nocardia nova]|uniref:hypothetical protein n=1 Tax=Nocardia nova TaxID=37330 RepID=UPI0033F55497
MARVNIGKQPSRQGISCLFCGGAGPLTREHVFPDWMREVIYKGDGERRIIPGDGGEPTIQHGGPFNKTLKIVCAGCNNEWMSRLEERAKPLLVAMFNQDPAGPKVALDSDSQLVLARWAFKTAAVASRLNRTEGIPVEHRREFSGAEGLPRKVQVWIGAGAALNSELAMFSFEPTLAKQIEIRDGQPVRSIDFETYRTHFRILGVVFVVNGYVSERVPYTLEPNDTLRSALLPLWPATHPRIWWPPVTNLDEFGGLSALAGPTEMHTVFL